MLHNFIIWLMSCYLPSDMHLNQTSFVLWLFSSFYDLFFLHCNWHFSRKNSAVASEKCDSMKWLLKYDYSLSNLILHWAIFQLFLFLLERKMCIYTPVFLDSSFSFLQLYWLLEKNQLESWVLNLKCFFQPLFMQQAFLNNPGFYIY